MPLYLGALMRAAADVLIYAYLPLHLHDALGESRLWLISLVPSAPALIRTFMSPVWGRLADRWARQRPFLIVGLFGYGLLLTVLPTLTSAGAVLAVVSITAVPFSAFNPIGKTWLTLESSSRTLFRLARWHQWEALGYVAGSTLVGWLVASGEAVRRGVMHLMAFVVLGCIVWVFLRIADRPVPVNRQPKPGYSAGNGFVATAGLPLAAVLFILVSSLSWESVATTYGLYYTQILHGTAKMYGTVLTAATFISFLAYGPLARYGQQSEPRTLFRQSAWGYNGMYLLLSLPSPWMAGAAYVVPMSTVVRTALNLLVVRHIPRSQRGRAMGGIDSIEASAGMIGALLGGLAGDTFGLSYIPKIAFITSLILHFCIPRAGDGSKSMPDISRSDR